MDVRIDNVTAVAPDLWVRDDPQWQPKTLVQPVQGGQKAAHSGLDHPEEHQESGTVLVTEKEVRNVVEDVQQYLLEHNIRLSFSLHDKTGDLVVRVLDKDTGEVIRQIPPEEMLKLREKLEQLTGVLLNGKV
jgi:flagellar protein FlaG